MSLISSGIIEKLFWEIDLPIAVIDSNKKCRFVSRKLAQAIDGASVASIDGWLLDLGGNKKAPQLAYQELIDNLAAKWPQIASLNLVAGEQIIPALEGQESEDSVSSYYNVRTLGQDYYLISFVMADEQASHFHSQRLNTLGLLAGGVAHDFNNILAGILGHISFLQAVLPQDGMHKESLEAIADGAKKASSLTGQILNFSRFDVSESYEVVDLAELVRSTALLIKGALTAAIELQIEAPEEPMKVLGVEGKLAQVLVNLVINARDAVAKSAGKVVVAVRPASEEENSRCIRQLQTEPTNKYLVLIVTDNGTGIRPELQARIFEPYFSTKGAMGTGLGLSTVAQIVDAHGGTIEVSSCLGQGTSIRIFLKSEDTPVDALKEDETKGFNIGGSERILVLDDEEAVRGVVAMSLRHLGYKVEELSDPRQTIEMAEQDNFPYDLIICDMLMPFASGEDVVMAIRKMNRNIPVLIMSGYSEQGAITRVMKLPHTDFIQKPFTIEELAKKIRTSMKSS